ncbi:hypothetical protein EJ06DRAFT_282054 [Trichodelitschia bisporula]|uniref:Uncharacterized protein n=1 Tax=Trichodelitschia bisporula TaxID=703511 RepID=A0A6G1I6B6_9PEZI|nr:hypothetical protein EJ06DRAFT_282054 [Trichodelitschia bisporula]
MQHKPTHPTAAGDLDLLQDATQQYRRYMRSSAQNRDIAALMRTMFESVSNVVTRARAGLDPREGSDDDRELEMKGRLSPLPFPFKRKAGMAKVSDAEEGTPAQPGIVVGGLEGWLPGQEGLPETMPAGWGEEWEEWPLHGFGAAGQG